MSKFRKTLCAKGVDKPGRNVHKDGPSRNKMEKIRLRRAKEREESAMLPVWLLLMLNGLFVSLRLTGGEGSFPRPLKAEEERACLEAMAAGDPEARDRLIEHNLRLVAHIVKKYYTPNGDQDDLISIGTIGLIKGITTFKSDKNVRLATYASRCIENAILT